MTHLLERFEGLVHRINNGLLWTGSFLLVLTMMEAVLNMALRPLARPIQGSFELMGFASAVVASFGLAHCQEVKNHICVDILFRKMPRGMRALLEALGNGLCCLFFGMASYRIALLALTMYRSGEVSETLRLPYYPFTAGVALGFAALSLTLFTDTLKALFRRRG